MAQFKLENQARNGANWFFWIAGMSILNTIIYRAGGKLTFIIGLGATQFVAGFTTALIRDLGPKASTILHLVAIGIDIGLAGIFIIAGLLSRKKYRWVLIAGAVLYIADGLIFIWVGDWLAVAFHAFALWGLWGGLKALNALMKVPVAQPVTATIAPVVQDVSWFRSEMVRILAGSCAVYVGVVVILAIIGFILTR